MRALDAADATPFAARRTRDRRFFAVCALLFAASAASTAVCCASMSRMGEMPMPGGWSMSMVWMRMPDQTWLGAGASFLGMWVVMMAAMMLPSLVPMLWRYRRAIASADRACIDRLTWLAGLAYLLVWAGIGAVVFALGAALATSVMRVPALARAVPLAAGWLLMIAGAVEFSAWKARHLACCQNMPYPGQVLAAHAGTAWRHGLRLGLHCSCCSAAAMMVLLVFGVMDLRVMAIVAMAITAQRFATSARHAIWAIGAATIGAAAVLIAIEVAAVFSQSATPSRLQRQRPRSRSHGLQARRAPQRVASCCKRHRASGPLPPT